MEVTNPCLRYEGKTEEERSLVIFEGTSVITISMDSSRRDLFIDIVVDGSILKNNQITLYPFFTFRPKTGVGPLETEISFCCEAGDNYRRKLG